MKCQQNEETKQQNLSIDLNQTSATQNMQQDLLIFTSEDHPSMLIQIINQKEGFSIFNMFDFTVNRIGRSNLRRLFSSPLQNLNEIKDRHLCQQLIECFQIHFNELDQSNLKFQDFLQKKISRFIDFETTLNHKEVNQYYSSLTWKNILTNITLFSQIDTLFQNALTNFTAEEMKYFQDCSFFQLFVNIDKDKLRGLTQVIQNGLDLDSSDRPQLKRGIFQSLDQKRDSYENIDRELNQRVLELLPHIQILPAFMSKLKLVMMPSVGYFVVVSKNDPSYLQFSDQYFYQAIQQIESRQEEQILQHILGHMIEKIGWKLMFVTETEIYFQNMLTLNLNQQYGDLYSSLLQEEFQYLTLIEKELLSHQAQLIQVNQFIKELDTYLSMVLANIEYSLIKPEFNLQNGFEIKNARNILVDFVKQDFISHNYSQSRPKLTLVTGVNGSGKSVYLRTLGQIIYLAQIGCYVPCEKANLSIFEKILTKFSLKEDSQRKLSLFYKEQEIIQQILQDSNERTLVLIDEYGKTTSQINGLACMTTLIQCLSNDVKLNDIQEDKQQNKLKSIPFAYIATNMKEILTNKQVSESENISFISMQVKENQQLKVFTYKAEDKLAHQDDSQIVCLNNLSIDSTIKQRYEYLHKGLSLGLRISSLKVLEQSQLEYAQKVLYNELK